MQKNEVDVSVIVTAHHEGYLAHPSMNSILRAVKYAEEHDIKIEFSVFLDRPDPKTQDYFKSYTDAQVKVHLVDFGDPGQSRNYGVQQALGKYAAFLDADDLFGKTWLKTAYETAEKNQKISVYYPEYVVCFEGENLLVKCKSTDDESFSPGKMIEHNCWNSVHFFAPKVLLTQIPFAPTPLDSGFGYEDWHWYCEVLGSGIAIQIVPKTCIFYRKKLLGSRLFEHNHHHVVIPKSRLFEPENFSSILMRTE